MQALFVGNPQPQRERVRVRQSFTSLPRSTMPALKVGDPLPLHQVHADPDLSSEREQTCFKPELLSPAGTLQNMRYVAYGADAVYAGQPRSRAARA